MAGQYILMYCAKKKKKFDINIIFSDYSKDLVAHSLKFPTKKISKSGLVQGFLAIPSPVLEPGRIKTMKPNSTRGLPSGRVVNPKTQPYPAHCAVYIE